MAEIKIEAMKFYAFHGCFDEERVVGTHFEADCTIEVNCNQAAQTDNLSYTINYQEVYQLIKQEIEQPSALLENVAYRILSSLKQLTRAIAVTTHKVISKNKCLFFIFCCFNMMCKST